MFLYLLINSAFIYLSTNIYCIHTRISDSSTFMPMAFKEKSVQPKMVGGGKKTLKLLKIFIFYLKTKVKSFKYLIHRLTLASCY